MLAYTYMQRNKQTSTHTHTHTHTKIRITKPSTIPQIRHVNSDNWQLKMLPYVYILAAYLWL